MAEIGDVVITGKCVACKKKQSTKMFQLNQQFMYEMCNECFKAWMFIVIQELNSFLLNRRITK